MSYQFQVSPKTAVPGKASSLLKLAAVAKLLGMAAITVRRRVKDGSLAHVRIEGRLYFKIADVHAFVDRRSHSCIADHE